MCVCVCVCVDRQTDIYIDRLKYLYVESLGGDVHIYMYIHIYMRVCVCVCD